MCFTASLPGTSVPQAWKVRGMAKSACGGLARAPSVKFHRDDYPSPTHRFAMDGAPSYGLRIALCVAVLLLGPPWRISSASAAAAGGEIQLTSISPNSGWNTHQLEEVTITGGGFTFHMSVTLLRAGRPTIEATNVIPFSARQLTASFDLTGAEPGLWDLTVSHETFGSATLPAAMGVMQTPLLERVGTWGGPVHSMQVVGNLGYLARGSGMVILDLTDPANMVELSVTDMGGGVVNDLAVQGDYAFVCVASRGINIYDISDPTDPSPVVARLHRDEGDNYTDICLHGNAAYAIERPYSGTYGAIYKLDISDPTGLDPSAGGNLQYLDELVWNATAANNHLFVVGQSPDDADNELRIYDLSADPLAPQLISTTSLLYPSDYDATAITVDGGFAYVTLYCMPHDFEAMLLSVDVSNPELPLLTDLATELTLARGVAASNGFVFVADYEWMTAAQLRVAKGLAVFDVSTSPGRPALVGQFLTHGAVRDVVAAGTTAYLLDDGEGVIALDVSNPANPVRLGTYHSPAWMQNLQKEGDILYLSDYWNGVTALNVSDPSNPTLAGFYQTDAGTRTGHIGSVKVQNGLAYLAAGYNGLEVVDFSDPQNPALIGGYQDPDSSEFARMDAELAVKDHVLIAQTYRWSTTGTWVFDVSVPTDPTVAFRLNQGTRDVWEITDEFLAFGVPRDRFSSGVVHDLLDLTNPVIDDGSHHRFGPGATMAVEGNRLYTNENERSGHVRVNEYTMSPDRVVTVSSLAGQQMRYPEALGVQDGIIYVTSSETGLTLLDARDPRTGMYVISARADDMGYHHSCVYVDGPNVYLGGRSDGYGHLFDSDPGLVIYQVATPGSSRIDGDVDLRDFGMLQNCFTGPDGSTRAGECRANFDFDDDGDVDIQDAGQFTAVMTGAH